MEKKETVCGRMKKSLVGSRRKGLQIKKALYILSIWVGFGWWESEDI
jgi:hypothetical protein